MLSRRHGNMCYKIMAKYIVLLVTFIIGVSATWFYSFGSNKLNSDDLSVALIDQSAEDRPQQTEVEPQSSANSKHDSRQPIQINTNDYRSDIINNLERLVAFEHKK